MKVDDIRIRSQITSGLQINSVTAFNWVKEAIEDICHKNYYAGARVTETATITDTSTDYTILKPLLKLDEITNTETNNPLSNSDYKLNDDNKITFKDPGTYKIEYRAMPDMPQTVNSEIPLTQFFTPCIEFFLAYKIRARLFGQNDSNAVSFFQQYEIGRENAELARERQAKKRRMPPNWR
jgi:hypothetical protein